MPPWLEPRTPDFNGMTLAWGKVKVAANYAGQGRLCLAVYIYSRSCDGFPRGEVASAKCFPFALGDIACNLPSPLRQHTPCS